jgi:hypothetical protein
LAERRNEKVVNLVDIERAKQLLEYNSETGIFRWKVSPNKRIAEWSVAGTNHTEGYISISVDRKRVLAHRLAWMFVYGRPPHGEIDHINRVRNDNRISNLREATSASNKQNLSMRSDNKSAIMGVNWHKASQKWRAYVSVNGRQISLGYYDSIHAAKAAREEGKKKHHIF